MYAPLDFFVKNGYGSKYLTGLLTPEGITFLALLNNFLDLDNIQLYYGVIIIRNLRLFAHGIFHEIEMRQ